MAMWAESGRPPFMDWPAVPGFEKGETRVLYHMCNLSAAHIAELEAKGWLARDVRLLPDNNDDDVRERIKSFLQGVMLGSIEADSSLYRFVEAGMKVFGLNKGTQEQSTQRDASLDGDVETLLNLNGKSPAAVRAGS